MTHDPDQKLEFFISATRRDLGNATKQLIDADSSRPYSLPWNCGRRTLTPC